jgi:hypothetical protein
MELGVMVHIVVPATQDIEAGGQGQPGQHKGSLS